MFVSLMSSSVRHRFIFSVTSSLHGLRTETHIDSGLQIKPFGRGCNLRETVYLFKVAAIGTREEELFGKRLNIIKRMMKLFSNRALKARGVLMNFASLTLKPQTDCPSVRRHMRL